MQSTITQQINTLSSERDQRALQPVFRELADSKSSWSLISAGLVIKAGASALVKTGASAWYGLAKGSLVTKAAATDMAALSGTVVNATFNVFCYYVNNAGTLTTVMGTAGATLAAVKFPNQVQNTCMIGFTIINPTGTGNFVGGTTAIDDATVVPNAVHISVIGSPDPTLLVG